MNVFVLSSFHIGFFPQVIFRLISNPVVILYFTVVSHICTKIHYPRYFIIVLVTWWWKMPVETLSWRAERWRGWSPSWRQLSSQLLPESRFDFLYKIVLALVWFGCLSSPTYCSLRHSTILLATCAVLLIVFLQDRKQGTAKSPVQSCRELYRSRSRHHLPRSFACNSKKKKVLPPPPLTSI